MVCATVTNSQPSAGSLKVARTVYRVCSSNSSFRLQFCANRSKLFVRISTAQKAHWAKMKAGNTRLARTMLVGRIQWTTTKHSALALRVKLLIRL